MSADLAGLRFVPAADEYEAAVSAARLVLRVARGVDLGALPFTGTRLHAAQRELRTRQEEIGRLVSTLGP